MAATRVKRNRKEDKAFGLAIKHRLLEVEMTQKELSEIAGINPKYLYFITNGIRGAVNVYINSRNNNEVSESGLKAMAKLMGILI